MRHRTNSEIKAYVDGYTACFNQYSECLKNRKDGNCEIKMLEWLKKESAP